MPLWGYTVVSGLSALALLYTFICIFKPFGLFKRRWHAALGIFAIAIFGTVMYSIPPARPEGIDAQDWTRRTALCEQLDGSSPTCLQESLALAPAEAITTLEARLAAQTLRAEQQSVAAATTAQTSQTQPIARPPAAETSAQSSPAVPRNWTYVDDVDEMRDSTIHHACTESTNVVRLGFPYGTQRVRLCVRQHPRWGQDVIVRLENEGQFLCYSFDTCTVRVRFDEGEVSAFSALGPSDNSTNSIFIQNDERFLRGLKSSSRVIVEAEFFQAGNQQMAFDTAGLEWPRP